MVISAVKGGRPGSVVTEGEENKAGWEESVLGCGLAGSRVRARVDPGKQQALVHGAHLPTPLTARTLLLPPPPPPGSLHQEKDAEW